MFHEYTNEDPQQVKVYIGVADPRTCQLDVQDIEQLILMKKKPPRA